MTDSSPLVISKQSDAYWRATFDNPPLTLIDPETVLWTVIEFLWPRGR
ncbi:hypothetical protein ABIA33_006969 [Streptacidiphilus sp. MAP12-16]